MDDLQLLREMRSDVGTPAQATLARGRNTLLRKIDPAGSGSAIGGVPGSGISGVAALDGGTRRRRTVTRRFVLAAAAAAVLVGGIVVADVVAPAGRPGATAEAADVLNKAAAATIKTSDPVVKPGQYLKVDTKAVYGAGAQMPDGSDGNWFYSTEDQLYVPADKSADWVWKRGPQVPMGFPDEETKAFALKLYEQRKAEQPPAGKFNPTAGGLLRLKGGVFEGHERAVLIGTSLKDSASLPRDPQKLLDLIYERTKGAGKTPDIEAFVTIADGLRTGVVPADLRAAMYKAAALIPGVVMADKQATVDGRTGTAIGMPSPDGGGRQDIIIDPSSGLVIGERNITLKDYPGAPAGTVQSWTAIKTSVVDSAP